MPRVGGALSARWEEVSRDFDFDVKRATGRNSMLYFTTKMSVQNVLVVSGDLERV